MGITRQKAEEILAKRGLEPALDLDGTDTPPRNGGAANAEAVAPQIEVLQRKYGSREGRSARATAYTARDVLPAQGSDTIIKARSLDARQLPSTKAVVVSEADDDVIGEQG